MIISKYSNIMLWACCIWTKPCKQCIQLFVKGKVSEIIQINGIIQHFTFSFPNVVNVIRTKTNIISFPFFIDLSVHHCFWIQKGSLEHDTHCPRSSSRPKFLFLNIECTFILYLTISNNNLTWPRNFLKTNQITSDFSKVQPLALKKISGKKHLW